VNETQIFTNALKLATPTERAAYLDEACAGDAGLRADVEALLRAHANDPGFLEQPPPALGATADLRPALGEPAAPQPEASGLDHSGMVLAGRYKLLEVIGEGGMGTVWMAQQTEPVKRLVAVKLIKPGDSRTVLARFDAERQALALMDHPNIAKVFDAGATRDGRPFFVMELVKGVPLTRYCDKHRLTPRQRLELFGAVCQAVQHAHQKGIIHRDIKPSNVLVAPYDGRPVVKVIDFGVAKAASQLLTERTLFTEFGAVVGTLEYMSPEQAELNNADIDTRSDIYSLGVLLYELLTGTTPLSRERLKQAGFAEVLRVIREEEPPRPSTRLSESKDSLPTISAQRQMAPAQLTKLVCGELDWIVMKALEKDRGRRYETANSFAMDLQRYLADEPVQACPPSVGYRFRKFARRNKSVLSAAGLIAAALLLGTAVAIYFAVRARHEALRAGEAKLLSDHRLYVAHLTLAGRAWEENQIPRLRELLDGQRPERTGGTDLRGFEWHYWHRRCLPELLNFKAATFGVYDIAFSPDGRQLASAGGQTVKFWDAASGQEVFSLKGHEYQDVTGVAFSARGGLFASAGSDGTVQLWDLARREPIATPQTGKPVAGVFRVAFSPDGKLLAYTGLDESVKVWNVGTGKEAFAHKQATSFWTPGSPITFSPDGKRLAAARQDVVKVWDLDTGSMHSFHWSDLDSFPVIPVRAVAFSPDGKRLARGFQDGTVHVDNLVGNEPSRSLRGHTKSVGGVAFSPDGSRLASAGEDGAVRIWDVAAGHDILVLKGHTQGVTAVAFYRDGRRLASTSRDGTVRVWDVVGGQQVLTNEGPEKDEAGTVIDADKREVRLYRPRRHGIGCVAFSPDWKWLATAGEDKSVKVWDSAAGREIFSLLGHTHSVWAVTFSPDGKRLASASDDKTVRVWDFASRQEIAILEGHTSLACGVAFSPDGKRLASAGYDKTVRVWDTATGKEVLSLPGHASVVRDVTFSPDGMYLGSAGFDKTVRVWDAGSGREVLRFDGNSHFNSVAFSPDGKWLAAAGDGTIQVWDVAAGSERLTLRGHVGTVWRIAFTPDGRRLASAGNDRTVRLWDMFSGEETLTLRGHSGEVMGVAFSPDGNRLASAGSDGTVRVWDATPVDE
jgi:eukaryotic-like serine/threonine-protein kinase